MPQTSMRASGGDPRGAGGLARLLCAQLTGPSATVSYKTLRGSDSLQLCRHVCGRNQQPDLQYAAPPTPHQAPQQASRPGVNHTIVSNGASSGGGSPFPCGDEFASPQVGRHQASHG